ncbi:MAG: sulfotransferase [Anaerolineales bacterium]|nr:sulfotransferase [Anaerolineales bacterium]
MISPELPDHPIFICGHPKAGTSLLRAVFDSHPQLIAYPEESMFFRRFLPRAQGLDLDGQLELADQLLIHIFTWNRQNPPASQAGFPDRDYSAISYQAVRQAMRDWLATRLTADPGVLNAGDILCAAVLAYGQVSSQITDQTRYWIEKSPYNEYYAGQIFAWWPEARCIHIVRDPRDNYVSYRRKHSSWGAEFFAANWQRSTQAGMRNQENFGAWRYLLLRYEDLAQAPEKTLHQMVEFLQIEWSPSLADPTRAGEQWQGNSMFANQFQSISAAPVGRWKESLSPQEAAVIEIKNRFLMEAWQYPTQASQQFIPALAARLRLLAWPLRRKFIPRQPAAE